jgi:hypothetical protein
MALTVKMIESDVERGNEASGSPVCTDTLAVTGLAIKAAGITAVSSVLLLTVVCKKVLEPLADHTTTL